MTRAIALALQLLAAAPALSQGNGVDLVPKPYVYIGGGRFEPDTGGVFTNRDGGGALAIGFGKGFAPRLSWEANFLYFDQEIDTPAAFRPAPLFFRTASRADIESYGVAGQLRFGTTFWRLEPYAAAGLGWYRSQLEVHRTSGLTIFSLTDASVKRSDRGIGTQLQLGANFRLGERLLLSYQHRALSLKANFGNEVPGPVDVGGKFRVVTLGGTF